MRAFDRPRLLLALLLTAVVLTYFWTPTDSDVWWHLEVGRSIVATGAVPHVDTYSYTVAGLPVIMHEWLLEVLMYLLTRGLGYGATVLVFALATAATYAVLYGVLRGIGARPPLAVALLLGPIVLGAPSWGVRPQVWTPLFFAGFLALLLRYQRHAAAPGGPATGWGGPDRALWLLPPGMLLWTNMHAGFTGGLLLLGAFLAGEVANRALGWPAAPLRPLLAVTAACLAVTLITPYGLDLWRYVAGYLGASSSASGLRVIQEWQPPDVQTIRGWPFAASLVGLLVLNLVRRGPTGATPDGSRSPGDAGLILALAGFTVLALQAVRHLSLYATVWAVAATERLVDLWPALGHPGGPGDRPAATPAAAARFGRLNAGLYGLTTLALAAAIFSSPRAQIQAAPLATAYPAAALAYLRHPPAPLPAPLHLFHEYAWGGYLLAQGWPVFIDGRTVPYEGGIIDAYVTATNGLGWPELVRTYQVNAVLIAPTTPLAATLAATPAWRLAYQDAQAVLYLPR